MQEKAQAEHKPTKEERDIFTQAYGYFVRHCNPPPSQLEAACDWWDAAAREMNELNSAYPQCPMMSGMLLAVYEYMEAKARQRAKELEALEHG